MKKFLLNYRLVLGSLFGLAIIIVFLMSFSADASVTVVASGLCGSGGGNSGCSVTGMNNTGATLFVLQISSFDAGLGGSSINSTNIADNGGNTWTCTTPVSSGVHAIGMICYVLNPAVLSVQNITINTGNMSAFFTAFSGNGTHVGTVTSGSANATTIQPGSQSPGSGSLLVTGVSGYAGSLVTPTISAPFTIPASGSYGGSTSVDGGIAYKEVTDFSSYNPTWTIPSNTFGIVSEMLAFCTSTCGAPPPATLAITSATLASNGKTLTVPITNCISTLAPSSGITGFSVAYGGNNVALSSVTASGCTVTVNLTSPEQTGDALTVSLASGGSTNLNEGSNSPSSSGNSNVSITNNSTQTGATASYNSSNIYLPGYWSTSGSSQVPTYWSTAHNGWVEFTCTNCTDAQILASTTGEKASIDGGSFTTFSPTLASNSWQPLMTGASSGTHNIKIFTASFVSANSLRVSSSAGAAFTPITAYQTANFYSPLTTPYTDHVANFGFPSSASGVGQLQWKTTNGGFSFVTDATSIGMVTYDIGNVYQVYRDGTLFATAPATSELEYGYLQLATSSGSHTYQVFANDPNQNASIVLTQLVLKGGSSGTFTGVATAPTFTLDACGDSIVAYLFMTSGGNGDLFRSTFAVGAADQHFGNSGAQVSGTLETWCAANMVLPSPATHVMLTGGVNDQIGNVNTTTFQTAYQNMITSVANTSGLLAAGGKIFIRAILPNLGTHSDQRGNYNTAISAAVTAYNSGSPSHPAIYIPTDNWFDPSDATLTTGDGIHPSDIGSPRIGNIETPIMGGLVPGGSSYTLSGSGTGNIGSPTTFTVALAGGATWTGAGVAGVSPAETLTCSYSGTGGGTFSPSQPFAPTSGGNTGTFTFTPTSSGTGTISCSSAQAGWVNPSGVSYTMSGVPGTPTIGSPSRNGSGSINVPFTAPGSNGGSTITSYTAISTPGSITGTLSQAGSGTIVVNGLTNGTSYTFTVHATNGTGNSGESGISSAITPAIAPATPSAPSASAPGNTTATVTFTAPSNNGDPITGYVVTSIPSGGTDTDTGTTTLTHHMTGLTNGTPYTFTVIATNGVGPSSASSASNSVTPSTTPGIPTIGSVTRNGSGTINVAFTAPVSNGGAGIGSYTAISTPGSITGTVTQAGSGTIVVSGLNNGTPYTFKVHAHNANGDSSDSSASGAITPAAAPDAPVPTASVNGTSQTATVTFTAPSNNGDPITGYVVTSIPSGGTDTDTGTTTLTHHMTGLTNGTPYTFTVIATNGVGPSSASSASNSVTPSTTPSTPTIGTATPGDASASVSFTPGSTGGAPTTYTVTSSPGSLTGTGSSSPITVSGLTNDTAYTFTVTASNTNGSSSPSGSSSPVTPTASLVVIPPAPVVTSSGSSGGGYPLVPIQVVQPTTPVITTPSIPSSFSFTLPIAPTTPKSYIKIVQSFLNINLNTHLSTDGIAGKLTTAAIKTFQKKYGLVADGVFGPKTRERVNALTVTCGVGEVFNISTGAHC